MTAVTAPAVTWEDVRGAAIAALAPLAAQPGVPMDPTRPLRTVGRYLGEFDERDPARASTTWSGRCPAALVAIGGEKPKRRTIANRTAQVELTLIVIVVTDAHRSTREERTAIDPLVAAVRFALVGTTLGLAIPPLFYDGLVVVSDSPQVYAVAVRLMTRLWYDWTHAPQNGAGSPTIDELVITGR